MKHVFKKSLALSVLSLAFVGSAMAATSTAPLQVSATLANSCAISVAPMDFGTVTPTPTGSVDVTVAITYKCTRATAANIGISPGGSGNAFSRSMGGTTGNTQRLEYNIYRNNTHSAIFMEPNGGNDIAITATGASQSVPIYGQVLLNQYVKPDSYSDNLTLSIVY